MDIIFRIIIPSFFLIFKFLFKFAIGRDPSWSEFFEDLCGFPVDIIFLALSFATAYTLLTLPYPLVGVCGCFIFFILAFIVVLIWRKSRNWKDKENPNKYWVVLFLIGLFISVFCLILSIDFLYRKVGIESVPKIEVRSACLKSDSLKNKSNDSITNHSKKASK